MLNYIYSNFHRVLMEVTAHPNALDKSYSVCPKPHFSIHSISRQSSSLHVLNLPHLFKLASLFTRFSFFLSVTIFFAELNIAMLFCFSFFCRTCLSCTTSQIVHVYDGPQAILFEILLQYRRRIYFRIAASYCICSISFTCLGICFFRTT